MTKTLPFTHHVLSMGRNLQALGQDGAAARLLNRLSSFRELPSDLAGETYLRLAEMHLNQRQYKQARRRLTALLALQPDNAHANFLMAEAALEDEARNPRRAMLHYRHCTRLEPANANYWCALGELALYQGDSARGLDALRRAERLAPDDVTIVNQVVKCLRCEGKVAEAKQILRATLFRHPRDKRFADLWSEHQFEVLHEAQAELKQRWKLAQENGPLLLPFVRSHRSENPPRADAKRIRFDPPSGTPAPKGPLRRQSRKKKA